MKIAGLQKLTLLDYPGKTACTLFTQGCNFRCPFCQNAELIDGTGQGPEMEQEEVFSFLKKRKGLLDGICVSGGEPLLHPELAHFLSRVKEMGFLVKLDTNGCFPARLKALIQGGLVDYVAMDIKNDLEHYGSAAGLDLISTQAVEESAALLMQKEIEYEFRTTVVKELHKRENFLAIAHWLEGAERYYMQGFIDSPQVLIKGLHAYEKQELEGFRDLVREKIPHTEIRGV